MSILYSLILACNFSFGYEVNNYASSEPGMTVIEVIDDCKYSHKLLILEELLETHKIQDWLELLIVSGEFNKCK